MNDALAGAGAVSGSECGVRGQADAAAVDKDLQRVLQSRLGGGGLGGLQRSGSAPPYVDDGDFTDLDSLSNAWNQQSGGWSGGLGAQAIEDAANANRNVDALTDPAYAEYYYQHRNTNPRLPPPTSSSRSWQRSNSQNYDNNNNSNSNGHGGIAVDQGGGGSSLFAHVDVMYRNGLDPRHNPMSAHHQEPASDPWGPDASKGLMGLSPLATKPNGGMPAAGNTWDGQEAGGMHVSSPVFGHPSSPFAPRPVGPSAADSLALPRKNLAVKARSGSGAGYGSAPGTPTKRSSEGIDSRLSNDDSVTRFSRQATISSQYGVSRNGPSSKLGWNPPLPDFGGEFLGASSQPVTPTMSNPRASNTLQTSHDHMVSQVAEQLSGQHLDGAGRIRMQGHTASPRNASPLSLSPRSITPSPPRGSYFQPQHSQMEQGSAPPDMMNNSMYSHMGGGFSQPMQNHDGGAGMDPALAAAFFQQQQQPPQAQGEQAAMQAQQLQAQAAAAMYMMNPMMYAQPNLQAAAMAQAAAMGMYPGMGMGLPPHFNPAILMQMAGNSQPPNVGGAGMPGLPPELAAYQQRMMEMYAATAAAASGGPNAFNPQAAALAAAAAAAGGQNDPMAARMAAMLGAMQGSNPNSGKTSPEPELPNDLNTYNEERPRSGRGGRDRRDGGRGRRNDNRELDPDHGCPLLEQLKSNKTKKIELQDVVGSVMEFCTDQHGSRFIQLKLESSTPEETSAIFDEVMPTVISLMTDVFGNYVVQKFFEHGSEEQRLRLSKSLDGNVLSLSLQMYGCRVVQKALEILPLSHQQKIVAELSGHVMRCVRDQNGNHVIQKCIECVPTGEVAFMLDSFTGHVASLSVHPYGCRVIQRVLEHCTDEVRVRSVMTEVLAATCDLVQDQYGNYVVQHVLERGVPADRTTIVKQLAGRIVEMSQHKFASNVVEKCLQHGSYVDRQILIGEIIGNSEENDPLQSMMKDQFGNYVVQKLLEVCDDSQREQLLARIKQHLHNLKKYTYGKHIVSRVEKLITNTQKLIRGASSASAQLLPGPNVGSPMNSPRKRSY